MTKLKYMRMKKGYTQVELAEKAGVSLRTLQCYEQGNKIFDHARIDTILKICIALECKMKDVIEHKYYIDLINKYNEMRNEKGE